MRLPAIALAAVIVSVSGAAAIIGGARADTECRECRELRDDLDHLKRQVSDLGQQVDTLERDIKRHREGQRIVVHANRDLRYMADPQRCEDDEVLAGYGRVNGEDRIRGSCAELKIEYP